MVAQLDFKELHWLLAIVQGIDVGIVVLDRDYKIRVWNGFMQNHSGRSVQEASGQSFFSIFPEVPEHWFKHKVENVVALGMPSFTVWEQRPYLVRFKNYQPITGQEEHMYQNTTLLPLMSSNSQIEHVCLIVYDVTNTATNRQQLQALNAQLEQQAHTDRLTGLLNRGRWEETLKQEFERSTRYGSAMALLMFDIDHFKSVNDTFGHQAGDKVIQLLAQTVAKTIRSTDIAGRYGGEEFAVLLPGVNKTGARLFAERLRKRIEGLKVAYDGQEIGFTISVGIADTDDNPKSYEELISRADQALYSSKHAGRNRVTIYGDSAA